ncbi:MAG TPA: D-alanine--D-alanine ligase [Desulfomonilia bacterium]
MLIGLTYDLKDDYLKEGFSKEETAEFDSIETIEAIEKSLLSLGYETERIGNSKQLIKKLASGKTWDMVFNIAEGMYGTGRESLVPALLDEYRIPYTFSDPLVLSLCLHKGITKSIVRNHGIATADFEIIEDERRLEAIELSYPLFIKPACEGTGKGIDGSSKIDSPEGLKATVPRLLAAYKQPLLVETYLPGREFTVGITGTGEDSRCVGAMEVLLKKGAREELIYSYYNKSNYEQIIDYCIPEKEVLDSCSEMALAVWKSLGCRDAGRIDMRMDDKGILNFMEVNPLAGLNPIHSDLPIIARLNAISYEAIIDEIMKSAQKRMSV